MFALTMDLDSMLAVDPVAWRLIKVCHLKCLLVVRFFSSGFQNHTSTVRGEWGSKRNKINYWLLLGRTHYYTHQMCLMSRFRISCFRIDTVWIAKPCYLGSTHEDSLNQCEYVSVVIVFLLGTIQKAWSIRYSPFQSCLARTRLLTFECCANAASEFPQ